MRTLAASLLCASVLAPLIGCSAAVDTAPPAAREPVIIPLDLAACRALLRDDESLESLQQAAVRSGAYFDETTPSMVSVFGRSVSRSSLVGIIETAANALTAADVASLICDRYRVYRVELDKPPTIDTYTELTLAARRQRQDPFAIPVYEPPSDVVELDLSQFCPSCEQRVTEGRVDGHRVVPYYSRSEIAAGVLGGQDYELGWVADPIDAFLLQLRGSGTLEFEDGTRMYLAYASANGRTRGEIGRSLVHQGKLSPTQATLAGIGGYLRSHPEEAAAIANAEERQVFFGVAPVGPVGGLGVPITPGRTVAVDMRVYPKGAMGFMRTVDGEKGRFVFLQDSGLGFQGTDRLGLFIGGDEPARTEQPVEMYLVLPD